MFIFKFLLDYIFPSTNILFSKKYSPQIFWIKNKQISLH